MDLRKLTTSKLQDQTLKNSAKQLFAEQFGGVEETSEQLLADEPASSGDDLTRAIFAVIDSIGIINDVLEESDEIIVSRHCKGVSADQVMEKMSNGDWSLIDVLNIRAAVFEATDFAGVLEREKKHLAQVGGVVAPLTGVL